VPSTRTEVRARPAHLTWRISVVRPTSASARQRPSRFVPMSSLPARRVTGRAGHPASQSLPVLPVVVARRRRHARRSGHGLPLVDGAHRHHGAGPGRVGPRPPVHGVRAAAAQPDGRRRQPAAAHAVGRTAAGSTAVPVGPPEPALRSGHPRSAASATTPPFFVDFTVLSTAKSTKNRPVAGAASDHARRSRATRQGRVART
jgi:hypothetical protein